MDLESQLTVGETASQSSRSHQPLTQIMRKGQPLRFQSQEKTQSTFAKIPSPRQGRQDGLEPRAVGCVLATRCWVSHQGAKHLRTSVEDRAVSARFPPGGLPVRLPSPLTSPAACPA
ncbi:hypothetical protein TrLO_g3228 [Triparma laevis f. longispina]|uniref:Uncharacterized protein n=1 Tax=Triparma laevis f. longispina TaxID=1714387 RepID=A0A9W7E156_9STRA|nr:hypothetical protein TrLO_g3228 [Triparma laevis f. longispina]